MHYVWESNVLHDAVAVRERLVSERGSGKKLVTTNGCFDVVHAGHLQYLSEAAHHGDVLVVGINADAVVKKLKGSGRPLQKEHDRAAIVASLKMVDYTFIFSEEDPRAFLRILKPDVHVKGGDYSGDVVERATVEEHGGRMVFVSFFQGYSTTGIIASMEKRISSR